MSTMECEATKKCFLKKLLNTISSINPVSPRGASRTLYPQQELAGPHVFSEVLSSL